ncbi:MAG: hypothetical protein U0T82_14385 [Bacteroidales bacterium]
MKKLNPSFGGISAFTMALAGFLFLSFTSSFAQNSKAVFTGNWALNESKSQLGEGFGRRAATKLVITQDAAVLTVERTSTRQNGEVVTTTEKYNFDGSETDNSTGNRQKKSTASWSADGQTFTVNSTTIFERDGNTMEMKSIEVFKLGTDKTLVIDNTMSSQRGDFKTMLVYDPAK